MNGSSAASAVLRHSVYLAVRSQAACRTRDGDALAGYFAFP
jgi:hypothetical protein